MTGTRRRPTCGRPCSACSVRPSGAASSVRPQPSPPPRSSGCRQRRGISGRATMMRSARMCACVRLRTTPASSAPAAVRSHATDGWWCTPTRAACTSSRSTAARRGTCRSRAGWVKARCGICCPAGCPTANGSSPISSAPVASRNRASGSSACPARRARCATARKRCRCRPTERTSRFRQKDPRWATRTPAAWPPTARPSTR